MKIVITCAGSKVAHAGRMKSSDGKPVEFVAHPHKVANPDDVSDDGPTWRERLQIYNEVSLAANPRNLAPAYELYKPDVYRRLVDVFGLENVHVLSAGWGLVKASFLLPKYDITFSSARKVEPFKRRRKSDSFCDFNHLDKGCADNLLFFGGVGYRPLFLELTEGYVGRRVVYFNSADIPDGNRVQPARFRTRTKTNWQYECATLVANRYASDRTRIDPERSVDP